MLGYVRTHAPDLRIRDQHVYRALYCGLCRRMGACTGQCSRMALSYDFVFLAAVRMSLCGEKHEEKPFRCFVHPLKKRAAVVSSPTLDYCADATAILTLEKCRDDVRDERGARRLRGKLLSLWFAPAGKRAARRHPELQAKIADALSRLHCIEEDRKENASADLPAAVFGELMGAVFAEGLEASEARIARALGDAIGRWIYLADAADDLIEDQKKQRYNPYLRAFGDRLPSKEEKESIRLAMLGVLSDAESAFSLIDTFPGSEYREILCNILYLGLPRAIDSVLHLPNDEKEKQS